ncbi:MAG: choice-of-anchor tandem repeat GloVer-containing protein [Rhodospirillales bacterium]
MQTITYLACPVLVLALSSQAHAAAEKIIHPFHGARDISTPQAPLVADAAGNLYGTSYAGGQFGNGTVFEFVHPDGTHGWTKKLLYSFTGSGSDGAHAQSAVTIDSAGNLYGTTSGGGQYFGGTAWELVKPTGDGSWQEVILHAFGNNNDGNSPHGTLLPGSDGALYGTTLFGGASFAGTVFRLVNSNGTWSETTIYEFTGGADGDLCASSLTADAAGNLYGTTLAGGNTSNGVVFELSPAKSGWEQKVLYSFDATNDGHGPQTGVVFDKHGNLFGTTASGGTSAYGTVFELTKPTHGGVSWTETVLHNFAYAVEGSPAIALPVIDANGNIWGTSAGGTAHLGAVWEMTQPAGGGDWTLNVVHNFTGAPDGSGPNGLTLLRPNLFGTTQTGGISKIINGNQGQGAFFKIIR